MASSPQSNAKPGRFGTIGRLRFDVESLVLSDGNEIVVTGDRFDLLAEIRANWLPTAVTVWGEPDGGALFEGRPPEPGLAYVCQGRSCQVPAADAATPAGQLEPLLV